MKRIVIFLVMAVMAVAAPMAKTALDKAAEDYNQELYTRALDAYLAQAKTGEVSADLYYNMGNTYYRLKDNARAILYYERALLIEPGHSDARFNLEFVRTRAGVDEERVANILAAWAETAMGRLSSNAWAIVALVSFLLVLAAVAAYAFMDAVAWRKAGFFGAIVALAVTVLSLVCAWRMHDRAVAHRQAIVMAAPARLSTSPRAPKDKTEVAFELPAGVKVTIADRVSAAGVEWCRVETANRRQAWVKAADIEII